jgi:hypothetical protein
MKAMRPAALASLAVVLALSGCGGATPKQTESAKSAAIPRSVADRLAAQSESIAAAWEAGDECGAAQQADDLRHAADDSIASGDVPAAYQDELESAVVNLQNTANCVEEDDHEDDGKGKDEGKGKGHDKHDDTATITTDTTLGTTTEDSD